MQAVHPFVTTLRYRRVLGAWPWWEDVRCVACGAEMTFQVRRRDWAGLGLLTTQPTNLLRTLSPTADTERGNVGDVTEA